MIVKQFDSLYTLDSRGKVRVFNIFIKNNIEDGRMEIHSSTGLLGGKLINKIELVKQGKANRDIQAQALLQADALWKDKWAEGYKSKRFLDSTLSERNFNRKPDGTHFRTLFPGDTELNAVIRQVNIYLPHWTHTNENWDELPMLASKYKDQKKNIKFPVYIQPKFNGVRALCKRQNNSFKLISRGGTYYNIPHLEMQLTILFEKLGESFILDGELYKHNVPLQDISGAARTQEEGMLIGSNGWLEYHIYDVVDLNNVVRDQKSREEARLAIRNLSTALNLSHIKFAKSNVALDHTEIKENHDDYIEEGYEGAIVRLQDAKYEFNQRSKGLIKVKEFLDEEFVIRGFTSNPNKTVEESFVFILENNNGDGQRFEARPSGTAAQKKNWAETIEDLTGKKATVRFQERSSGGLPIQGHVRSDLTEVLHIRKDWE